MIGIFDSGIGGLSVLKELISKLPNSNFLYYADNKNFPYGTKTPQEIQNYTYNALKVLEDKGSKLIIIACNTASIYLDQNISKEFKIPIIDLLSVAKNTNLDSKKIAIIASFQSIKSNVFNEIFPQSNKFFAMQELINMIENNKKEDAVKHIKENFHKFENVDSIYYGCTHFSIIDDIFREIFDGKEIIDPAKEVLKYIPENIKNHSFKQSIVFENSSYDKEFPLKCQKFLGIKN